MLRRTFLGLLGGAAAYAPHAAHAQRAMPVIGFLHSADATSFAPQLRFELVINLKAAKAIGHEVPASLVLRADRLIE